MKTGGFLFFASLFAVGVAGAGEHAPHPQVELGRRVFEQSWLKPPADDSPLAGESGDGLGPLFNGVSCVDCHRQGGTGGGGPNENNVDVVSVVLPFGIDEASRAAMLRRATKVHPAFGKQPHVILHQFGRDAAGRFDAYAEFRDDLLEQFPDLPRPAAETEIDLGGVRYQLAQRNTTSMFGGGAIDQVPPTTLMQVAEWQKANFPEQAGRPSLGGRGRFGWRGQVESLETFVRMACADECGLQVRAAGRGIHEQAAWPVGGRAIRGRLRGSDLSDEQVDALVAFSASLPAPRPVLPSDSVAAAEAAAGRRHFDQIGCSVCHVERVGPADQIYSDLLLHDLGRQLADRVKAPPPTASVAQFSASSTVIRSGQGYYSEATTETITRTRTIITPPSLNDFEVTTQEWKTPPLWGVADSAPYIHDGRAQTLDDAIRLHGGQAAGSSERYVGLPPNEQEQLLAFLGTLRAPRDLSGNDASTDGPEAR